MPSPLDPSLEEFIHLFSFYANNASAAQKITFLEEKIRELDQAVEDLQCVEDLSGYEGYAEKMANLQARKMTRLQVAERRRQLQLEALEAEYQARLHDLSFTLEDRVHEKQDNFGKRRGMIKVDQFLENLQQGEAKMASPTINGNWIEDDLERISSPMQGFVGAP